MRKPRRNTIREHRRAHGLTLDQLAAACAVHKQTVSGWERGIRLPSMSDREQLARTLGTTIAVLFPEVRP